MADLVAAAVRQREVGVALADAGKLGGEVGHPLRDEMDDLALALDAAARPPSCWPTGRCGGCARTACGQTTRLAMPVSSSMRDEHDALGLPGRCRTSTSPAASSQRPSRAAIASAQDTMRLACRSARRKETGWLRRVRPTWPIVLDDLATRGHRPERDGGLVDLRDDLGLRGPRRPRTAAAARRASALIAHSASRRARPKAVRKASASASWTSAAVGHARAAPEIVDRGEGLIGAGRDDRAPRGVLARPLHHAQAEPDGKAAVVLGRLQRAVPARGVDADRADLDAVLARVAHDLGRGVEAHRLRVQQRRAEHIRMPALQPGGGIGDQREGGRMAFGKAVAAEALQLR